MCDINDITNEARFRQYLTGFDEPKMSKQSADMFNALTELDEEEPSTKSKPITEEGAKKKKKQSSLLSYHYKRLKKKSDNPFSVQEFQKFISKRIPWLYDAKWKAMEPAKQTTRCDSRF